MSTSVPSRVGVDASNLATHRTGVGNYIHALLEPMCQLHPNTEFYLYSNESIAFADMPNVHLRVSRPKLRGPLWQNFQLPSLLRADRIEVFWGANGLVPFAVPRGVRRVVTIHDLAHRFAAASQESLVRWNRRLFQRVSARVSERVIAVSASTARDVEKYYGASVDCVIHPSIAPQYRRIEAVEAKEIADKYGLREPFLLTVGTMEPRKNIANLVRAYVGCVGEGMHLPLLVLVGGRGWLDSEISEVLASAEGAGTIKRLGYIPNDDLPGLYAACEAFILPSIYEGFGMPLLEAQLCGAPVIHGSHASMDEAAGGVGVATGSTVQEIRETLARLASGECPLACRLPSTIETDVTKSVSKLWDSIVAAHTAGSG